MPSTRVGTERRRQPAQRWWKPACRSDERYRDGDCHHGPSFLGYPSHHLESAVRVKEESHAPISRPL
jgi:hypothetical protein